MYRIRRDFLFLITSLLWGAVGALLIWRAFGWMSRESSALQAQLFLTAGLGAFAGYRFGFRQIVRKNVDRIRSMEATVKAWEFTSVRGYAIIIGMITMGVLLRNSEIPKEYLSLPYAAMGGMLLVGSAAMMKEFRDG